MKPTSIRLDEDTLASVDSEADERGLSRAVYLRKIVENRHESNRIRDEYEAKLDELRTENERLQRERRQILEQREEATDLVAVVERQQSLQERKAQASIFARMKWAVTGMPSES